MEHYLNDREITLMEMVDETLSNLYDCPGDKVAALTTNLVQLRARLDEVRAAQIEWTAFMWREAHGQVAS